MKKFSNFFKSNPFHPALEGKIVTDTLIDKKVWRIKINYGYRAMALYTKVGKQHRFVWYWIGSHEDYNKRV